MALVTKYLNKIEDEDFKFDPELLQGFISPAIFEFLTSTDSSAHTSELVNAQAPPASTDDHVPLHDHILPDLSKPSDNLDTHVEALILACSQHYEMEEEQQASNMHEAGYYILHQEAHLSDLLLHQNQKRRLLMLS
jgi:hypothetical protein